MKVNMEVKTFHAPVSDEYDEYPHAFCRIHDGHVNNGTSFGCENADSMTYDRIETAIDGASYKIMFWNTPEAKAKGKLCRPLYQIIDGKLTDVFTVDMDHPEAVNINNSDLDYENKILQLMRSDFSRQES